MRLTFATDLHGQMLLIERFFKHSVHNSADVIILGGDICPRAFASMEHRISTQRDFLTKQFIPLLEKFNKNHPDKMLFAMFGNDDYRSNYPLMEAAEQKGIFHLIHKGSHRAWSQIIIGCQYINTSPFALKDWEKDDYKTIVLKGVTTTPREDWSPLIEDLKALKTSDMRKTILVTHAPPFGTALDMIHSGEHVGSKAIADFIREKQPLLAFSGHIHESSQVSGRWQENIGKTPCMNPGSDPFRNKSSMLIVDITGNTVINAQRTPI